MNMFSFILRLLAPGYGTCLRCKMPWKFVKKHRTVIKLYIRYFPLCQSCWEKLKTAKKRMPYYKMLWRIYSWDHPEVSWREIKEVIEKE